MLTVRGFLSTSPKSYHEAAHNLLARELWRHLSPGVLEVTALSRGYEPYFCTGRQDEGMQHPSDGLAAAQRVAASAATSATLQHDANTLLQRTVAAGQHLSSHSRSTVAPAACSSSTKRPAAASSTRRVVGLARFHRNNCVGGSAAFAPTRLVEDLESTAEQLAALKLPPHFGESYERFGIKKLHAWQVKALLDRDGEVLEGHTNFVFTAPTSCGKTLVAEILMLRRLMDARSKGVGSGRASAVAAGGAGERPTRKRPIALWVVPLVVLVNEVVERFNSRLNHSSMLKRDALNVVAYCGGPKEKPGEGGGHSSRVASISPRALRKVDIAVCTYEKANAILDSLAGARQLEHLARPPAPGTCGNLQARTFAPELDRV